MKQTQRHDAIIELVKKQGYVSTEELVEQFAVSPQTIRRDLGGFSRTENDPPAITAARGAALQLRSTPLARSQSDPDGGERALSPGGWPADLPDRATLFIDIGTTPEAVAPCSIATICGL